MGFLHFGGSWWVNSKKDPRWNRSGHAPDVNGMFMSQDAKDYIEAMKNILGDPPDDLEYGCMKD